MVNATRVDMYNYPEAIVNNGIHPGNEYTVSAHFRTAMINGVRKTGKPRLQVCCVTFRDNVSYDTWHEQKWIFLNRLPIMEKSEDTLSLSKCQQTIFRNSTH